MISYCDKMFRAIFIKKVIITFWRSWLLSLRLHKKCKMLTRNKYLYLPKVAEYGYEKQKIIHFQLYIIQQCFTHLNYSARHSAIVFHSLWIIPTYH